MVPTTEMLMKLRRDFTYVDGVKYGVGSKNGRDSRDDRDSTVKRGGRDGMDTKHDRDIKDQQRSDSTDI